MAIALRLAIAQVLSGRVEAIIMDEPTTHLDEERRKELVNIELLFQGRRQNYTSNVDNNSSS